MTTDNKNNDGIAVSAIMISLVSICLCIPSLANSEIFVSKQKRLEQINEIVNIRLETLEMETEVQRLKESAPIRVLKPKEIDC